MSKCCIIKLRTILFSLYRRQWGFWKNLSSYTRYYKVSLFEYTFLPSGISLFFLDWQIHKLRSRNFNQEYQTFYLGFYLQRKPLVFPLEIKNLLIWPSLGHSLAITKGFLFVLPIFLVAHIHINKRNDGLLRYEAFHTIQNGCNRL